MEQMQLTMLMKHVVVQGDNNDDGEIDIDDYDDKYGCCGNDDDKFYYDEDDNVR
jgi:hypothetical protein